MTSHYMPRLMEPVGPQLFRAFCGEAVAAGCHRDEPTCRRCQQLLEADATTADALRAQFARETEAA